MYVAMIFPFLFWGLIIYVIYRAIKGLINPATRKKVLIEIGIVFLVIALFIGYIAYSFSRNFRWQQRDYDVSHNSYVTSSIIAKPVADNIESFYILPALRDSDYWYQTGWYPSIEDLSDSMNLEDEQRSEFISLVQNASETNTFGNSKLSSIPASDGRDVTFYEVRLDNIFEGHDQGWQLGYFVVVDRNSSEVSLAAFYKET